MLKLVQVGVFRSFVVFLLRCPVSTPSALWDVHFIMPGFVPFGTGESEPSSSLRSREQRTTTRTRDVGHNKNMKQACLEERQQQDGKSGYCSEAMSAGCICGNLSMCSQPEMRGREVKRNQRFNGEPRRSKQQQVISQRWQNDQTGGQGSNDESRLRLATLHLQCTRSCGKQHSDQRPAELRPAGSSWLPMKVEMHHTEIFQGKKTSFCMAVKGAFS